MPPKAEKRILKSRGSHLLHQGHSVICNTGVADTITAPRISTWGSLVSQHLHFLLWPQDHVWPTPLVGWKNQEVKALEATLNLGEGAGRQIPQLPCSVGSEALRCLNTDSRGPQWDWASLPTMGTSSNTQLTAFLSLLIALLTLTLLLEFPVTLQINNLHWILVSAFALENRT